MILTLYKLILNKAAGCIWL